MAIESYRGCSKMESQQKSYRFFKTFKKIPKHTEHVRIICTGGYLLRKGVREDVPVFFGIPFARVSFLEDNSRTGKYFAGKLSKFLLLTHDRNSKSAIRCTRKVEEFTLS